MLFGLYFLNIYFTFCFSGILIILIYLGAFLFALSVTGISFFDLSLTICIPLDRLIYSFNFLYFINSPKETSFNCYLI